MAFDYFAAQKVDLAVIEVGMGGRLDSTNLIVPEVAVITKIDFDHEHFLGHSIEEIAAEKAGIIKPGIPIVTATDAPDALHVIQETASRQSAPLTIVPASEAHAPPLDTLQMPLLGEHQRMNAAVAIAAVRALAACAPVDEPTVRAGLSGVHWPGRLQLVTRPSGQRVLLDGAHNVGGAEMLAAALRQHFSSTQPALVLGILRDKDWTRMCEILAPLAGRILLVPVHSERTAEPHGLAEVCHRVNPHARVVECSSLSAALQETADSSFLTIAGSLYLIGEAMELLQLSAAKTENERGLNEWSVPSRFG
jgi:dihydrofolate synthase/folylpolyglutamate synthase